MFLSPLLLATGCKRRKREVPVPDGGIEDAARLPAPDRSILRFDTRITPHNDGAPGDLPPPADGPTGPRPDLYIGALMAKVSGSTVVYSLDICNGGKAAAKALYVDLYYHRATAPPHGSYGQASLQQPMLAAGICATVSLTRHHTPPGSYRSWGRVDTDGAIAESNEGNNSKGPVTVNVTVKLPDLVVQKLSVDSKGNDKITVRYRVAVCNKGTGTAGASDVHVYYDRQSPPPAVAGDSAASVPQLPAGSCVTREVLRSNTPNGLYTSWARVDVKGTVKESDEARCPRSTWCSHGPPWGSAAPARPSSRPASFR